LVYNLLLLQAAKASYSRNIGYAIAVVFPNEDAWKMFHCYTADNLNALSYLVGAS